jgi:hypothetical protein
MAQESQCKFKACSSNSNTAKNVKLQQCIYLSQYIKIVSFNMESVSELLTR